MEISDEIVDAAIAGGTAGLRVEHPETARYPEDYDAEEEAHAQIYMRCALEAVAPAIRAQALEEAAKVAEGPEYQRDGKGEVYLRGAEDGNWYVPTTDFPNVGGYGQGRADAAAAIRLAKETA